MVWNERGLSFLLAFPAIFCCSVCMSVCHVFSLRAHGLTAEKKGNAVKKKLMDSNDRRLPLSPRRREAKGEAEGRTGA